MEELADTRSEPGRDTRGDCENLPGDARVGRGRESSGVRFGDSRRRPLAHSGSGGDGVEIGALPGAPRRYARWNRRAVFGDRGRYTALEWIARERGAQGRASADLCRRRAAHRAFKE